MPKLTRVFVRRTLARTHARYGIDARQWIKSTRCGKHATHRSIPTFSTSVTPHGAGPRWLLLLVVLLLRLRIVFEKQRPFFVSREVLVGRQERLRRRDANANLELGFGAALH